MTSGPPPAGETPPLRSSLLRLGAKALFVAVAAFVLASAMEWAMTSAGSVADDISTGMMLGAIAVFLLVYAILIAVPFVPGIEIGIALLVLQGDAVAPYVYLATLVGLCLAFGVGQTVPEAWLQRLFSDLRLMRASRLVERTSRLSRAERLAALKGTLPRWLAPLAGSGRYLLLAALLNIPGNGLIGGGGGLAMLAGLSRVYTPGWTILTMALAVAPVPLIVWISGGVPLGLG